MKSLGAGRSGVALLWPHEYYIIILKLVCTLVHLTTLGALALQG